MYTRHSFMFFRKNNINPFRHHPLLDETPRQKTRRKCATSQIRFRLRRRYGSDVKYGHRRPSTIPALSRHRNLGFLGQWKLRNGPELLFEDCPPFRPVRQKQYRCGRGRGRLRLPRRNFRLFYQQFT